MKKTLLALLISQALFFSTNAFSQNSIFLKVVSDGVPFKGGSTVKGYENQIEVLSFSDGFKGCDAQSAGAKTTDRSACLVSYAGFSLALPLSLAATSFQVAQLQSKMITSADLVMVKMSGSAPIEYYKIHMEDIMVSSFSVAAGGDSPTISVELRPTKIAWKITTQNAAGGPGASSSTGWDFATNKAFAYGF